MKRARSHSLAAASALALALIAFLAVNLASGLGLGLARLDFSAGHIYTLSPATVDLLKDLKEPIRLRFYASPALGDSSGQYAGYQQHVRDLLDVYRRRSHGRIAVDNITPEPFSAEEDRAFSFGLRGVPIDNEGNQAYFGIVATNSTDQTQVIPFLTPEREVFLEYDLTRLIASLGQPKKPIVGLIDGTGMGGMQGGGQAKPWVVYEQMRTQFTIHPIDPQASAIDPSVAVLMIVHPRALSPAIQFAIDQFVLGGGHALVFVDPDAESVPGSAQQAMSSGVTGGGASDMAPFFKAWGIDYDTKTIVADWGQSMRVEGESYGRPVVTEFPPYIQVKPPYLDIADPVTGDLKIVNMVTSGAFVPSPGAKTTLTKLIASSPHALLADAADTAGNADPLAFLSKYRPGDRSFVMAARITGPAVSIFPDGPPKPVDPKTKIITQATKPIDVIVVGDVDILADHTWVQIRSMMGQEIAAPFASNGDFVINALENLTGSPALASLRGRGIASRPLTRIEDLQRVADTEYRATEEQLSEKLNETRRKLLSLAPAKPEASGNATAPVLNDEQQQALQSFREEMTTTRAALRDVRHNLRHDIERLEHEIEFADIVLVPLAVVIFALLLAYGGRRRL